MSKGGVQPEIASFQGGIFCVLFLRILIQFFKTPVVGHEPPQILTTVRLKSVTIPMFLIGYT